jgi:hypothetical protein
MSPPAQFWLTKNESRSSDSCVAPLGNGSGDAGGNAEPDHAKSLQRIELIDEPNTSDDSLGHYWPFSAGVRDSIGRGTVDIARRLQSANPNRFCYLYRGALARVTLLSPNFS